MARDAAALLLWLCLLAAGSFAARLRKSQVRQLRVSPKVTGVSNSSAVLAVNSSALPVVQSFKLKLENFKFVQYYAPITVGGQELPAIYDTGSFELIVLSDLCKSCDVSVPVYKSSKSDTFKPGSRIVKTHYFGSGPVVGKQGLETVRIGGSDSPLAVADMPFWQVVDHGMDVWNRGARFAAIVGMGHTDVTPLHHANGQPDIVLVERAHLQEFAVCLERQRSSKAEDPWHQIEEVPGWLSFGADVAEMKKEPGFVTMPVLGKVHWAVTLSNFAPGIADRSPCEPSCGAIIDSGTSLIAADYKVLKSIEGLIDSVKEDCSNMHELPDLVFHLDNKEFVLPPSAWVLQINEALIDDQTILDVLFRKPRLLMPKTCIAGFTQLDGDTQLGPMIILGMPFLRRYYTIFDRSHPPKVHISPASASCKPLSATNFLLNTTKHGATHEPDDYLPTPVDLRAVRIPQWAKAAHGGNVIV
eukprot:gnl/TRDRNA2_/TRDRNA2_184261_c0_seq1.p1 gnl/TRDRNA2_/TRDRNA2_184261_c0~~gnl/TRDRNA2_/TRDRNA2_184261_c0_seq1.p1  ORF type:complete len:472 (+),score=71.61 gnl/TRDRNA2_/TRDRNA2_184261_c0_seq1:62-1477(+)